jgi:hypothetical protein
MNRSLHICLVTNDTSALRFALKSLGVAIYPGQAHLSVVTGITPFLLDWKHGTYAFSRSFMPALADTVVVLDGKNEVSPLFAHWYLLWNVPNATHIALGGSIKNNVYAGIGLNNVTWNKFARWVNKRRQPSLVLLMLFLKKHRYHAVYPFIDGGDYVFVRAERQSVIDVEYSPKLERAWNLNRIEIRSIQL